MLGPAGTANRVPRWLPPLTNPVPLNELIARDRRQPLRFALGDHGFNCAAVWGVDVSGRRLSVLGRTSNRKHCRRWDVGRRHTLTAQRSVLLHRRPRYGGPIYLENLPHVGGSQSVRARQGQTAVAEISRHAATGDHLQGTPSGLSIGMYRQLRDPSQPGCVRSTATSFLIIDGWPGFVGEFPTLRGRFKIWPLRLAFGVHVISTPRWTELKSRVRDYLGTRSSSGLVTSMKPVIDRITRDPGEGRGSVDGKYLMIGVFRSTAHSADNLVEAITAGVTQIASLCQYGTEHSSGSRGERIHLHELDLEPQAGPVRQHRTAGDFPIGLRDDLTPAHHMHTNPHLLILVRPNRQDDHCPRDRAPFAVPKQPSAGAAHAAAWTTVSVTRCRTPAGRRRDVTATARR